jgi:general secretion pathway protein G
MNNDPSNKHPHQHKEPAPEPRQSFRAQIVLAGIVVCVAVAIFLTQSGRSEAARRAAARTDISNLEKALDSFKIDCERYPTFDEGLSALVKAPADSPTWHGPYLRSVPLDPWGNPYIYSAPGTHSTSGFDISSSGADGVPDTADDIANWSSP